ncbi:MAG: glycosyltransferase family 4 protein [Chloroflexi bacterium]|nr:glycosyltransferase family 4 protein [Chloroflexota bacterium]
MRILYLYQYFVPVQGHGMTRAYEFARRLIAMGHDVKMVTSAGYLPEAYKSLTETTEIEISGIPCIVIPVPYSNYMSFPQRIRSFIRFALIASWRCMRHPADIVYASSAPLTIAIPAIAASRWQRIPFVFEVRDLWPELPIAIGALRNPLLKRAARALEWLAYHAARHVVALSPGQAEGVIKRGIDTNRVTVIPNSADVDLFDVPDGSGAPVREQLGLTPDQPLIVYTGTFGLMNNISYLVEIAVAMRSIAPDMRFLLIGAGGEFEKVMQTARDHGVLDDTVFIWEPRPKTEIPAILSAATVATSLFLPVKEMWNNSANKFFDALAAGRPIAINYCGWQAEILEATGAGIVIPDQDATQAAHDLAAFVHDAERVQAAREAARELAYSRFHRDTMTAQLEQLLRRVVTEGH